MVRVQCVSKAVNLIHMESSWARSLVVSRPRPNNAPAEIKFLYEILLDFQPP